MNTIKVTFQELLELWIVIQTLADGTLPCTDLINRLKYPNPQFKDRILLLHFDYINQGDLIDALENFTRLRDLHNNPPFFASQVILVNAIAIAFNASLTSLTDFPWQCYGQQRNFSKIMINAHLVAIENPSSALIPMADIGFNFAYCAHRKQKAGGMEMVKIFGDSADFRVWTCLLLTLVATTTLVKHGTVKDFSEVMLTISSVLLSPGMS